MTKQEQIDELKRRVEDLERKPAPVVVVPPPVVVEPWPYRCGCHTHGLRYCPTHYYGPYPNYYVFTTTAANHSHSYA